MEAKETFSRGVNLMIKVLCCSTVYLSAQNLNFFSSGEHAEVILLFLFNIFIF